ncbi:uncharacterized protein [Rutidosis leptorrhynchoides]|uniref:uncharacterized protein n=1 Tax=Rutidosis leptorrhynchoides TaxID=125765 RepID=UPI003A99EF30
MRMQRKSRIRVLFGTFSFIQFILISTLFITKSTSIPYSKYCNHIVKESISTDTQVLNPNLPQLDKAVYSVGFQNPQFNFNPSSSQIASFSTLKAYETNSKHVFKINSVLNLIGPEIVDYFSGEISRRGLRLVKVRPPRFVPRRNVGAGFSLSGFWNSDHGKLCMVGSGSVSSLHNVNVVFKLDFPNSTALDNSLINGTLQNIMDSGSSFKPVSILGVSVMGYNYTYIDKEIKDNGFSVYDDMGNVSLSLPDARAVNGRGICSIITWGLRFDLDYENYDCKNVSCSFVTVGDEMFPRFMSIKVVDCLEDGKVRYILQFSNSSYAKDLSFYPLTSLVAEGKWDKEKNRLVLVACQLLDINIKTLGGCSIRLAFSLPSKLSLKRRSSIVGKMWSTKTKNLGIVSFYSPANLNSRIKGMSYEYLEHEKVETLCRKGLDSNGEKRLTYPNDNYPNLRFDMMVRNKKGQMAYGYASPLYVGDKLYKPFVKIQLRNGYTNISYVISFTTRDEFEFGGKIPASKMVDISAEGVYNTNNGVLCMIGCKHLPYDKFQRKRFMDCELMIDINYSPKDAGPVHGTIKSTRKKHDPQYFEPIEFGSSSITTIQARESIWRMDFEITMVLISNTLSCIFIGLQLFHVKKNPEMLPFISVVMLVVLTLAHMIPLLLNFEAIFMLNRKQNVFLSTDQWLEVNEIMFNMFCDTHDIVLAPWFYVGSTMVRLLPHMYDLYRRNSSSWFYDKIYANPGMDYYSSMWDVVICFGGTICILIVYMQQRFGGQSMLPKRLRDVVHIQTVKGERVRYKKLLNHDNEQYSYMKRSSIDF